VRTRVYRAARPAAQSLQAVGLVRLECGPVSPPVLEVRDVYKTYRLGFFRKRIEAVRGISFKVERGEMLGFVGPNGAG